MSFLRRVMYTFWYLRRPPWDSGQTPPELLEYLKTRAPGRALDLGCGTGTNVVTMARLGWQVTGVDFVPRAIHKARLRARQAGVDVDLRVGDVTRLAGLDGKFDFALDLGCFHSLDAIERSMYLQHLGQLLQPGACWFLYAFVLADAQNNAIGLSPVDLEKIQKNFKLLSRMDGLERGSQASAYFIFEK